MSYLSSLIIIFTAIGSPQMRWIILSPGITDREKQSGCTIELGVLPASVPGRTSLLLRILNSPGLKDRIDWFLLQLLLTLWVIRKLSALMVSAAQSATFQRFARTPGKGSKTLQICLHESSRAVAYRPIAAEFLHSFQLLGSSFSFYGKERNILRTELIQPPKWYFFPPETG